MPKDKKIRILGINIDIIITSACLIEDGQIVAACAEERLNREKFSRVFPLNAINFCLEQGKCDISNIDYVAVGWNPGIHANKMNNRFSATNRWRAEQLYTVPNFFLHLLNDERVESVSQELVTNNSKLKIIYVDHHLTHASHFFMSPFKKAAILTCDGRGEDSTTTFSLGENNKIKEIDRIMLPHSLGLFYGSVTEFLGFRPHMDEWKVMALYSYFKYGSNPFLEKMRKLIKLLPEGKFELDLSYFSFYLHDVKSFLTEKFVKEFGKPRKRNDPICHEHYEIARALQMVTEETLAHMLNWLYEKTGQKNLVVNGGTFMNSVFNGKITEMTKFKEVSILSCPDDSGTSIGAALYVYHHILGKKNRDVMKHNYFGPEFSDANIKETLEKFQISYEKIDNIEQYAAEKISEGKIIGWFQGKMEFGQRALGNRSILADPRDSKMKDKINAAIKYRESFRPFAPSILIEKVKSYFDFHGSGEVPFMEKVFKIKEEKQKEIPAVTHIDGTGRLQTVDKRINPRYHKLISEFEKITGVPIILNTSFNLNGEPIVCSPQDAIRTFYSSGLDILIMGNLMVKK